MDINELMLLEHDKLTALLESASTDDKIIIHKILSVRDGFCDKKAFGEIEHKITDAAENYDVKEHVKELKTNIRHCCYFVPYNGKEWVKGFIAGVYIDTKSQKPLYAIKTFEGDKYIKVYDSMLLVILDEMLDDKISTRKKRNRKELYIPPEPIEDIARRCLEHVGKKASVTISNTGDNGKKSKETITGRIVCIMRDRRNHTIMYKIEIDLTYPIARKQRYLYRGCNSAELEIAEDFDEEGRIYNTKYYRRWEARLRFKILNPVEQYEFRQEILVKAQEKLERAQMRVERLLATCEKAKEKAENYIARMEIENQQEN